MFRRKLLPSSSGRGFYPLQLKGSCTRWRSWLRHCAGSRKVAGWFPDCVTGIFHWHNPSSLAMALGSTQPLTEISESKVFPLQALCVGRGIALLFHDRGTRRRRVVSSTPRPHFTPGKDPVPILQEAGWAPGLVWTGGKSRPHRDSIPDRPIRSQTEISTTNISCGVKAACAEGWKIYQLHVPIVLKSGSLNFLEPSGHVQACNVTALACYTFYNFNTNFYTLHIISIQFSIHVI